MAQYTMELRTIIESNANLFDFSYPFYDESKKEEFEKRFVKHFYMREIGLETVGRFKHYLELKFNETLPYYNMLFRTALLDYDILNNYNVTEKYTKKNIGENEENLTGTSTNNQTTNSTDKSNSTKSGTESNSSEKLIDVSESSNNEITGNRSNNSSISNTKNDTNTKKSTNSEEEKTDIAKTSKKESDLNNVESDTPSGLLSIGNIKKNVYASKANISDNTENVNDTEKGNNTKKNVLDESTTDKLIENGESSSTDTSRESSEGSVNTNSSETLSISGKNSENITASNTNDTNLSHNGSVNNTKNVTSENNEIFERSMFGNIGVTTSPDLLQKHIELQKTLTTIEKQFFSECEDLFMMIY